MVGSIVELIEGEVVDMSDVGFTIYTSNRRRHAVRDVLLTNLTCITMVFIERDDRILSDMFEYFLTTGDLHWRFLPLGAHGALLAL